MKRQIETIKNLNLATFEQKLQSLAKEGKLPPVGNESLNELNDIQSAPLSDEARQCFLNTVRRASHEKILLEASKKVLKAELPFGRHLQTIRDKSGLTQTDVAKLLNKSLSYINKIENGQVNPMSILTDDLADIMQLFRLTLSDLKSTVTAFLALSAVPASRIGVMARSSIKTGTKERGDGLAHAMDAALQAIAKKTTNQKKDSPQIDPSFLEAVLTTLEKRGEKNLLV